MTATREALNDFFASVQMKAFRQAEMATGNREEALDIVQDAMIRLAQKYSDQEENWPRLFQRILQNLIRDWYRRQKVRSILIWFQSAENQEEGSNNVDNLLEDKAGFAPDESLQQLQIHKKLQEALRRLPARQQQAFILRAWWEYDIKESAFAMECSEGSVKTHYSRAVKKLAEILGDLN